MIRLHLSNPKALLGRAEGGIRGLSRWRAPLVVVGVLFLALIGVLGGGLVLAGRPESCLACHEMQPHYQQWAASTHKGVVCIDCHTEPGIVGLVKIEASMVKNTAGHITGTYELPIRADVRDDSCLRCHPKDSRPEVLPEASLVIAHSAHDGIACAVCHGRLVHTLGEEQTTLQLTTHKENSEACRVCHTAENSPHGAGNVDCVSCHDANIPGHLTGDEKNVPARAGCIDCHNREHVSAPEDCQTCHVSPHGIDRACNQCHTSTDTWQEQTLVHPFSLEGGHAGVACTKCHTQGNQGATPGQAAPVTPVSARPSAQPSAKPSPDCATCHQPKHGPLGDNKCTTCHSANGWKPVSAAFDHKAIWSDYVGAHAKADCTSCHKNDTYAGTSPQCSSCHQPPQQPHFGTECGQCHKPGVTFKLQ